MSLLDLLAADVNAPDLMRGEIAVVTATAAGLVDLDVAGSPVVGVPCAATYPAASAVVGDVVIVVKLGSSWVVLAKLGTPSSLTGGPNLLPNPSFETGSIGTKPTDWENFWVAGTATAFVTASDQRHAGSYSAKATLGAANSGVSLQPLVKIPVQPSTLYKVSYWYRISSAMPAGASLNVQVMAAEDTPEPFSSDPTFTQTGVGVVSAPSQAGVWKYVESNWTSPATTSGLLFARPQYRADVGATSWVGTVWLDDLSLRTA